jgi:glycosyltransferase involved in cell wall biosynthesis
MRVSFVIPTRNQAAFLGRCLDSCLAQGLPGAEVLVVDGCSTDGTREVLARYGERVSWTSEPDSGQAQAVNRGVARARGDVVAWINSDDAYADPGALAAVVAAFEEDPRVDLVYGLADVVDAAGRRLRAYRNRRFGSAADLVVSPTGPSQPATFFRRELFLAVGGLREDLHWALDYDLMIRLFEAAREARFVPRTLALTTFHPGAKSIRGMRRQIAEVGRLKRAHAARLRLGARDRALLWGHLGGLWAYWAAVRLGLRRAA